MQSKRKKLDKGFDSLFSTNDNENEEELKDIKNNNVDEKSIKKSEDKRKKSVKTVQKKEKKKIVKSKDLRKVTLYIDPEIVDRLAIMKVRVKKDLSTLTGEALDKYLTTLEKQLDV